MSGFAMPARVFGNRDRPMDLHRYHRQMLLPQIGEAGQVRLARARVALIGCGALGCVIADQLVRAGVGYLRIIDRDLVELTNLQRQTLFDESDVAAQLPKAVAAARRLAKINSSVRVEGVVADLDSSNIERFIQASGKSVERFDLILDGTDNVGTRNLINDVSVKHEIPWIYGACVGTEGRVLAIRPPHTACLRCIFPEAPTPGELPTCDTAGVLAPVAGVVASLQVVAAIQLLTDHASAISEQLITLDLWRNRIHHTPTGDARRSDCPTCGQRLFAYLNDSMSRTSRLCGRNAVQVRSEHGELDSELLARRLQPFGTVERTDYFIRCTLNDEPLSLTIFSDGRTIVHGTNDPARARTIHARYLGA